MEPRVPRLLSWAVLGRVFGRGVAVLTLVALVALVAWPERRVPVQMLGLTLADGTIRWVPIDLTNLKAPITIRSPGNIVIRPRLVRDSSLAVLLGD